MSVEFAAGVLLIAVPVAFNLAFFELGRAFEYPNILRKEPDEILRRFHAGGSGLILRWQALLVSAIAMLPLVALVTMALALPAALAATSIVIGTGAALVQTLGLVRWPFAVPELARRYLAADNAETTDAAATRRTIEVVFATLHRLLGVGIGEHLGYLLTGALDAARGLVNPVDRRPRRLARPARLSDRGRAADRRPRVCRPE